jgi:hypothetical protein
MNHFRESQSLRAKHMAAGLLRSHRAEALGYCLANAHQSVEARQDATVHSEDVKEYLGMYSMT